MAEWIEALKIIIRIIYGAILPLWFFTYFLFFRNNKLEKTLMYLTHALLIFGMGQCLMVATGVLF